MLMCLVLGPLAGCAGAVVEQTSDVVIGVVKIPFKIGKAIVDLVVGTDDEEDKCPNTIGRRCREHVFN